VKPGKCKHCDNHANPAKAGLCNECSKQQGFVAQPSATITECINEDCKQPGFERFNFLCELCYKKQLEAINLQQKNTSGGSVGNTYVNTAPAQRNVDMINNPPQYQGYNQQQINPSLPNYPGNENPAFQQQQNHQYVNTGGYPGFGMQVQQQQNPLQQQPQQGNMLPGGMFPGNIQQGVPVMGQVGEKKQCKGLDCEFFGSEEFGGHCSACFLDITKKESEKQEGIQTYAPQGRTAPQDQPQRCLGEFCQNYGSQQRRGYCSECYKLMV